MTVLKGSERKYQVWQRYLVANGEHVAKLGDNVPFEDAAGTIANLITVIAAFSLVMGMGRIAPGQTPSAGKTVLVYGGSSSVGGLAIQVAARLGASVVTTASRKNWANVEERTTGKIADHTQTSDELITQLTPDGPYDYVFDTIGGPAVTDLLAKVLVQQGGGTIHSTFVSNEAYNMPPGVERKAYSYPSLLQDDDELNGWFNSMFGPALEQRRLIATRTEKVAGGLSALQGCLDRIADGKVSGVKLVVDPWG
jgi:NADPH:quinone reductase-like Zn-dependent oxidoreductase